MGNASSKWQGNFYKPRDFTIRDSNFYDISSLSDNFMKELAENTIPGASFDSSERDPPPRCHPGTRLAIVERIPRSFANRECNKRLIWLVGPAGVGKSAIMQTLAEAPSTPDLMLGASLFFSVNGRDNGSKAIVTLAYQLAVKSKPYREFVQRELAKDPKLLDKALTPQFNKFIIEPFVTQDIRPEGHKRFLILIDGLDECNDHGTQCTILNLISSACIMYPAAPLVWVVASRPEPHLTHFLSRDDVAPSYTKEEIEVDSDESREDGERYLHKELENIRTKYPALALLPSWPAERDFLKLATSTGGLFAYGSAVIHYIDDPIYANPVSQLQEVLEVIDEVRSRKGEGKRHPMTDLDALYSRIISKIPRGTLNDTKLLLLQIFHPPSIFTGDNNLRLYCNWLGMTTAAAYSALHHLHSVLNIPPVSDASLERPQFRHKSFRDYLADFERSGMFPDIEDEAHKLHTQCATRILDGASKARELGLDPYTGILLSWPPPTEFNKEYKGGQYHRASQFVLEDLTKRAETNTHCDPDVLSALKLIDIQQSHEFLFKSSHLLSLPSLIFGEYVRPILKELNAFQEASIGTLDMDKIPNWMGMLVFYRSQRQHSAPFPKCSTGHSHKEKGQSPGHPNGEHYWRFKYFPVDDCGCAKNALRNLEDRKTRSPDGILTTFADFTGNYGWVYHTFPDSKRASSTWEFIIPYQFKPDVA